MRLRGRDRRLIGRRPANRIRHATNVAATGHDERGQRCTPGSGDDRPVLVEHPSVDVTIGEDNPAVRDFLSMLPLTITLEEFAGREKINYLPRRLRHSGSPGSDPESGDLIYFVPWGNLGFYYNAEGIGYSDDTIHLGTYDAPLDQLERLEGEVTVEVID
jgi:hypothetical protein